MEPIHLTREDLDLLSKVFFDRLTDEEFIVEVDDRRRVVGVFRDTLGDCLFDNTELLEQLRLEGEADPWR